MQQIQATKRTSCLSQAFNRLTAKRVFDLTFSTVSLVAFSLPIAFVMAAMAIDTRSNPLFIDERVGKDGKPFRMFKIKTMRNEFNNEGKKIPESQRTSRFGVVIRKTRIDELPQLLNILMGDMSVVGPRPFRASDKKIAGNKTRQSFTPGLTGLAQVKGNNKLDEGEVLAFDRLYIHLFNRASAWGKITLDSAIIGATPLALLVHFKAPHFRAKRPSLPPPRSEIPTLPGPFGK